MKKVFTNRELPHIWANQLQNEGRNSSGNIYFEGNTIYSYGRHFPIATILEKEKVILVNSNNYSVTTSKHKHYVWRAINKEKYKVFDTKGCSSHHKDNIDNYIEDFNNCINLSVSSRKYKEMHLNNAKGIILIIEEYLKAFKLSVLKFKGLKAILKRKDNIITPEMENKIKERKAKERKLTLEKNKESINDWLNGASNKISYKVKDVFLRANISMGPEPSQVVETSQGARVSYTNAHLLYDMIKTGRDIKGHKIDGYTVIGINGVLKIGCHQIERKEIDRFAKSQNW
jgi:hypothetical protein